MRRASLFAVVAFLLGLGVGFFGRSALQPTDTRAVDLAAIEKLHVEDVKATLLQDPDALANVWTEDGVRLAPERPATVGKKAIQAENEKWWAEHPGFKVLTYEPKFKELQVVDGWAFEWGYLETQFVLSREAQPTTFRGKFLRILRRQTDGSWKFARVMGNATP